MPLVVYFAEMLVSKCFVVTKNVRKKVVKDHMLKKDLLRPLIKKMVGALSNGDISKISKYRIKVHFTNKSF